MLRNMFKKTYTVIDARRREKELKVPEGLFRKCRMCGQPVYGEDVKKNHYICPRCGGYFRVHAYRRVEMISDPGSFEEWNNHMEPVNPLSFPGYEEKLQAAGEKSRLDEAVITGKASIHGIPLMLAVCDARFMMGSMGHNVGEKIASAMERATAQKLPLVIYTCSGGARMQEGIVSLMQMAKTSAALKRHHEAGLLSIMVLTDPTTGGVTASFAMLGDIILAEPGALIGFAGPRVIAQTIGQKLPEGFQRAEFLLEHGFVDAIVRREDQRDTLGEILRLHQKPEEKQIYSRNIEKNLSRSLPESRRPGSAWEVVEYSRRADRPTALDYIHALMDSFIEFHGDRNFGDDGAIVGGIGELWGIPVTIIGEQKGKNTRDNISRNFGMPSPEGYRKALRLMRQAEVFHRPVICLVDTPGAYCGIEAEERGQGEAIARNLFELSDLTVPVLSLVIGEGGSGGALALAVADEVWMMEYAVYSILSPEGFASILWKDSKLAKKAAEQMKITAGDLKELGVIDEIIPEGNPITEKDLHPDTILGRNLKKKMFDFLVHYRAMTKEELVNRRYDRYRRM